MTIRLWPNLSGGIDLVCSKCGTTPIPHADPVFTLIAEVTKAETAHVLTRSHLRARDAAKPRRAMTE